MISDILSDAADAVDQYLESNEFDRVYEGDLRVRIMRLRAEMEEIRAILDAPPSVRENPAESTIEPPAQRP